MAEKGWIHKYAFENNALSADAIGRRAMEDRYLTRAKLGTELMGILGKTAWVVSVHASAAKKAFAQTLSDEGHPVWVCDGTSDEEEINAAILSVSSYGGTVELSDNLFYISSPVLIANRVELVGQGEANTVLIAAADTNIIEISGTVYNAAMRRFKVDGYNTRGGGAGWSGKGIVLTGGYSIVLEDIAAINTAEENIYCAGGSFFVFSRVYCSGAGEAGTDVVGISMNACSGPLWHRVTVWGATGNGILFSGVSDIHCTDVAVDQCRLGTTGYGWTISHAGGHMAGCSVGACGDVGIPGGGLYLTTAIEDLVITNFISKDHIGTGLYGLWVGHSSPMKNISISNSLVSGCAGPGAGFGGANEQLSFIGNTLEGNAQGDFIVHSGFAGSGVIANNSLGATSIDASADLSDFQFHGNRGVLGYGEKRVSRVPLTDALQDAISFAWQNPHSTAILIDKVVIDATTPSSAAASMDVGFDADGTGSGTDFFDDVPIDVADTYDSTIAAAQGQQTGGVLKMAANGGADDWITGTIRDASGADLVGFAYIYYTGI